jgi:hypothetical protein
MKKFLLSTVALFLSSQFFITAYGAEPTSLSPEIDFEAVQINAQEKVVPKKIREDDPVFHYTINVVYPQIGGNHLNKAAEDFNQRVAQMIDNEVKLFKARVKKEVAHMQTLPPDLQHNTLKIDYDFDVIQPLSLVSVRLSIENMQAGRAHPHHAHLVLNYDLVQNKELALNDLFKPKADFLQTLANYSSKKLHETVGEKDKWMIPEGTKPLAKNYKNWNIEADAILITFDEYQVAPYVYGAQEVEIPFAELENLLSKQAELIASSKDSKNNMG